MFAIMFLRIMWGLVDIYLFLRSSMVIVACFFDYSLKNNKNMNKTEKNQQPTLAVINFTGISVCATLIFAAFLSENIMLPVRLCMAICLVAVATIVNLGVKHFWLTVGAIFSAAALMAHEPASGLAYVAYIAAVFLFFRANPVCAEVVRNWFIGIFAPEKE